MTKIYVVVGQTGEYSDRTDWYVCAYPTRELAEKHEWAAKQAADKLIAEAKTSYWDVDCGSNPYDPGMKVYSLREIDYYVAEVELRDDLPVVEK